jgi:hypothetical protein
MCQIPCVTSGCDHETHRSIVCPVWLCKPSYTTTSSTTTTKTTSTSSSSTTTATGPSSTTTAISSTSTPSQITTGLPPPVPFPVSCHSVLLYVSLFFNVALVIGLIILLIKYLKVRREDREFEEELQRRLNPIVRVDRMRGQVGNFSIDSLENLLAEIENERQPLLQATTSHTTSHIRMTRFQTPESNESSVSDDTFLRNRPMSMNTFKPEAEKSKNPEMEESSV